MTITCKFPGCERPTSPNVGPGAPSVYCDDPTHTPGRARRARLAAVNAVADDSDNSVSAAGRRAGGVRDELVKLASELTARLDQATAELRVMADPDVAAGEIAAVTASAAATVAAAVAAQSRAEVAAAAAEVDRVEAEAAAAQLVAEMDALTATHAVDVLALDSALAEVAVAADANATLTSTLAEVTGDRDRLTANVADLETALTGARADHMTAVTAGARAETQAVGLTERVAELAASNAALTDAIGRLAPPAPAGR